MRTAVIKPSFPESWRRIAQFYQDNPDSDVFPRDIEAVASAGQKGALVHIEDDRRNILGVGGAYDTTDDTIDVGGIRIIANGYRLQVPVMQILAVTAYLAETGNRTITATAFADNVRSLHLCSAAGFEEWKSAPASLVASKEQKAAGRPFKILHLPDRGARKAAADILGREGSTLLIHSMSGQKLTLVTEHPVLTIWRSDLENLLEEPLTHACPMRRTGSSGRP